MRKFFSLLILTAAIFLLAAAATIFNKFEVPVGGLVRAFAAMISIATDREIEVQGDFSLLPGRWLHLKCENGKVYVNDPQQLRISATILRADTQINFLQLLHREVVLGHVSIHGMTIEGTTGLSQVTNSEAEQHDTLNRITNFIVRYTGLVKEISSLDIRDVGLSINSGLNKTPFVATRGSLTGFFGESQAGHLKIDAEIQKHTMTADLEFDPLLNLTSREATFSFSANLRYADAEFSMEGSISGSEGGYELDSDFRVKDFNFAEMSLVPGGRVPQGAAISCEGQLVLMPGKLKIHLDHFLPGTENLSASITLANSTHGDSSLVSEIIADQIDIDALMSVFARDTAPKTTPGSDPGDSNIRNDIVVFPEMLSEKSFALNIKVQKMRAAGRELVGLDTQILMDHGVIKDAPFATALKKLSIQGIYSLDVTREPPSLQVHYTTNSWDLGATLENLGLTEDVNFTVAATRCSYTASGRKLSELLRDLELTVQGNDGLLTLPDHNTGVALPVTINDFTLTRKPGAEIALQLQGQIAGKHIHASATVADNRGVPLGTIEQLPFRMTVDGEDSALKLAGMLPVPFSFVGTSLNFDLSGKDVASFSDLIKLEIPVAGPYRLIGNLHVVPAGYRIRNLEVALGDSLVTGDVYLETTPQTPKLSLALQAERIQLADLREDTSHAGRAANKRETASAPKDQETGIAASILRKLDATVTVEINKLLSGGDDIGSGSIHCELRDGKITVKPVHLFLPEGDIAAEFSMEPIGADRLYALKVDISNLDYGIFSRWFTPETDQRGILSLRSSLTTLVQGDEGFLSRATGYIDFCFQPENLRAGIVDLWAINLVSYLSPILMPTSESKLNCIAGRFNIDDGKMKNEDLLADTSKIQVKGTMDIDFASRWIESRLQPIPKRPQFYSLATPLQISGRLDNLQAGVARGGLIGTMIRLLTSYIVVPLQWLVNDRVPVDGTSHCITVYNQRDHRADDELRK